VYRKRPAQRVSCFIPGSLDDYVPEDHLLRHVRPPAVVFRPGAARRPPRPLALGIRGFRHSYLYNALRQRMRAAPAGGSATRYVYNGHRVLEETNDSGTVTNSRYTTLGSSYFGPLLHQWVSSGDLSRLPLYDGTGSARGLADASGTVTDTYALDAFGVKMASDGGSTPNPYHYDGAWGYITDPSGLQQLGYRFYWPELGRFIQQDPIGDGVNWYAYVRNSPVRWTDPLGLCDPCDPRDDDSPTIWGNLLHWHTWACAWEESDAYLDVGVNGGVGKMGTLGFKIGYDPLAAKKPWSLWHASTWHWVHPYGGIGSGGGGGLSVTLGTGRPRNGWWAGMFGGAGLMGGFGAQVFTDTDQGGGSLTLQGGGGAGGLYGASFF